MQELRMQVLFDFTDEEQQSIIEWKRGLPKASKRKFRYTFVDSGKRDNLNYKLFNFIIKSNDGYKLVVAKNVTL
jgi:hypothetical protein